MKKLTCFTALLLLAAFAFAEDAKKDTAPAAPKKNTLSVYRVWVKAGHEDAFKAAVAAHAQKFHTGNWKWRVNEVLTGPDGNSYSIGEGPNSWTDIDDRGNLGAEHDKDYAANIAPHVEKSSPDTYLVYEESASTTAAANWSNKSLVTQIYYKPGRGPATLALIKTFKPAWEKLGQNIVVWATSSSGEPRYILVRRLKNGLKDLDAGGPSLRQTYDGIYGSGAYERIQDEIARNTERSYGEILEFKPELSSK